MKILYVIAQKGFKDDEYFIPKKMFEEDGMVVDVTSEKIGEAIGSDGGIAKVDLPLSEASMQHYKAIVVAGGPGALSLDGNEDLKRLLLEAMKEDKLVCAICIAPVLLARAGILRNRSATVWNEDDKQAAELHKYNAMYFNEDIVLDKNIITANGPHAAEEFGKTIIEEL